MNAAAIQSERSLPHTLAVVLVALTFPLIWVGGLVTTYEAGMAVPDWPTTYGYNLFLYPWQTWLLGPWDLFVEHGHRLLGATVGIATIALLVSIALREPRRWVTALGVVALAAVIVQGVLGGMRVRLDERLLARLHGCFGPVFFALAVSLAVVTSRRWRSAVRRPSTGAGGSVPRLALATAALAYLQIVLGAHLRHLPAEWTPSAFRTLVAFHVLVAVLIAGHAVTLVLRARRGDAEPWLRRPAYAIGALVAVQLLLGAGTYVLNYAFPAWFAGYAWAENFVVTEHGMWQAAITTAHVAAGSLIFVAAVMLALRGFRLYGLPKLVHRGAIRAERAPA